MMQREGESLRPALGVQGRCLRVELWSGVFVYRGAEMSEGQESAWPAMAALLLRSAPRAGALPSSEAERCVYIFVNYEAV